MTKSTNLLNVLSLDILLAAILACRAIVIVLTLGGLLLWTGCVHATNDWPTQTSPSIADGLGSAISSLIEAALLSIVL